jgi:hypothetical protein
VRRGPGLRFQTNMLAPAALRCLAMGAPMFPSPTKPIRCPFNDSLVIIRPFLWQQVEKNAGRVYLTRRELLPACYTFRTLWQAKVASSELPKRRDQVRCEL